MTTKYKIQFHNRLKSAISIQWAFDRKEDYVPGDCYVRGISADTDVDEHNKAKCQKQVYTDALTLDEARQFVLDNVELLGEIHDCLGLTLEDRCEDKSVCFDKPVEVRNAK